MFDEDDMVGITLVQYLGDGREDILSASCGNQMDEVVAWLERVHKTAPCAR